MEDLLPTIRKTGSYTLTINPEQQQAIRKAVKNRTEQTGEKYGAIYERLSNKFKIARYQQLPASKFDEAIEYLGNIINTVQRASWHAQAGTPLYTLKNLGGWETLEMVNKYAHLNADYMLGFAHNVTFMAQDAKPDIFKTVINS